MLLQQLKLTNLSMDDFHYLNQSGCVNVNSINDINGEELSFHETQNALKSMKFNEDEIHFVYNILSGILHLGNIEYEDGNERCHVMDSTSIYVNSASSLFEIVDDNLSNVLKQRVRIVGGQPIISPLTASEACQTRDALAKDIYNKLFSWLVQRINSTIAQMKSHTFIGILDIYGFEDLTPNGFEQLFINYAVSINFNFNFLFIFLTKTFFFVFFVNLIPPFSFLQNEKLQALFNEHVFKLEEEEYSRENIVFDPQEFPDNQKCLDLIDKPPRGILMLINEQCMRGDVGSDSALASKLHRTHGDINNVGGSGGHSNYELAGPSTVWRGTDSNFVIKHYAGKIMYTTDGFVRKNRDTLLDTIEACMYKSKNIYLSKLYASSTGAKAVKNKNGGGVRSSDRPSGRRSNRARGGRGGNARGTAISVTVGKKFKDQLSALIKTMQATTPRFVRCIKSNTEKLPLHFEAPNILRQLKYAGVMEALRVRRAGRSCIYLLLYFFTKKLTNLLL